MAGGEPRLGTTATYMRHNDHGTTRPSTEIDRLHDRRDNEYRVFSAGSVRKWSKFGLDTFVFNFSMFSFFGRGPGSVPKYSHAAAPAHRRRTTSTGVRASTISYRRASSRDRTSR